MIYINIVQISMYIRTSEHLHWCYLSLLPGHARWCGTFQIQSTSLSVLLTVLYNHDDGNGNGNDDGCGDDTACQPQDLSIAPKMRTACPTTVGVQVRNNVTAL